MLFKMGKKRQGHPDVRAKRPMETITADNLATVIQRGDATVIQRTNNVCMNPELHWFHKLSQAVMIAFQPETYAIAQKSINLLETSASKIVRDRIKSSGNAFKHGEFYQALFGFFFFQSFQTFILNLDQISAIVLFQVNRLHTTLK